MSNTHDTYQDLVAGDRDDHAVGTSGGGGAILGVLMTLVIGCGLVFAAYKLGQRTTVDEPPVLTAEAQPAKMEPIDEGGRLIANQDNDAYAMVDEQTRDANGYAVQDGVIIEQPLPAREVDPVAALSDTVAQADALSVDELEPASSITGQPELTDNAAPDRTGERELAGGAEVTVPDSETILLAGQTQGGAGVAQPGTLQADGTQFGLNTGTVGSAAGAAIGAATGAIVVGNGTGDTGVATATAGQNPALASTAPAATQLPTAPDTVIASTATRNLTPEDFGAVIAVPSPRPKPDLFASVQRARSAGALIAPTQAPSAAVATTRAPLQQPGAVGTLQVQPAVAAPQPGVIPPQPAGDAQVQLGAMPSPDLVRARFRNLQSLNPDLLGSLGLKIMPVRTAQGQELFRLRVGPLSNSREAAQLCDQLRFRGVECFVPAR